MSKAKTEAAEAETTPVTTPEGQDTVAATDPAPEGQEAAGADAQPTTDTDGNPPSDETPGDDDTAADDAEEARLAAAEAERQERIAAEQAEAAARAAAQADADAKHQAKVQAKAARDARAAERAARADEKARANRLESLNRQLTIIERGNNDQLRAGLIDALTGGAEAVFDDQIFSFLDITVIQANTPERTLADWCMEARRQIMALS